MAFTLRILFDGLCVFVPNTEESKGVRVLMIDARAPGVASNGDGQVSHIASIRFPLADLAPGAKQPAHRIEYSSQDPVPRGQWYLNGDDLQILANGKPLPDRPLVVLRQHPTRDFDLVPSMRVIYPETDGVSVRDECLSSDLVRLADAGLVGRLRLQAGTLGVWDGADGRYVSSDEYMFTGNPTLYRQRIASRTFFETEIEAAEVEIFSRQRGQGIVLRPADGERVEIVIENQPPMDLMSAKPGDPDVDWDFELNYLVAKDAPKPFRLPIRAAAAWARLHDAQPAEAPSVAAGIREKPCSGTHYSPSEEAGGQGVNCPPTSYRPTEEAAASSRPICPGTEFGPSREAGGAGVECNSVVLNPSAEAAASNPKCPPVTFAPSQEAGGDPYCPSVIFRPSGEAAIESRPICPGVRFAPSEEAGLTDTLCPPVIFRPNGEASGENRPLCPGVRFKPSTEAGPYDLTICPMIQFPPHPRA
ncbi:MAG TPA: hypothetical protein VGS22_05810 [Thermoanaerobaculia bacterium]|jgi:hypothetical protein|nr:hypothetical protein [Thermoanaerobaculia bacterium]